MQRALMWLKNRQKCIFGVFGLFLSLLWTASQPYRLSHINALYIDQCYLSKDQSMKFSRKNVENWQFWKCHFFSVGHSEFSKIFFCFIPMKISRKLCVRMEGTQFLWLLWFTAKNDPQQVLCLKESWKKSLNSSVVWCTIVLCVLTCLGSCIMTV